jgi:hypothetical protein
MIEKRNTYADSAVEQVERQLILPSEAYRLEEINFAAAMAASLRGKQVTVQVFPEEEAFTRRINPPKESSGWIDPKGNYWNDYQPLILLFTASDGRVWRFPRSWLTRPQIVKPSIDSGHIFSEGN